MGLEGRIGRPNPLIEAGMRAEHKESADSHEEFKTGATANRSAPWRRAAWPRVRLG